MGLIDMEVKRALAQPGISAGGGSFGGGIPNPEGSYFEVGDTFTVPTVFTVLNQTIGSNTTQFIIVEVTSAAGVVTAKRLYPSTFTKSRMVANEDGSLTGNRVSASGTAVTCYRNCSTVDEGMRALSGKTLIVSKATKVRCLRYGTTQVIDSVILTIDIVPEVQQADKQE